MEQDTQALQKWVFIRIRHFVDLFEKEKDATKLESILRALEQIVRTAQNQLQHIKETANSRA